ncbi:ribonuclease H-like domain-containing protein [Tanacetum coccineum]
MPSRHPMVTRSRDGTTKPVDHLNLHVATLAPILKTHVQASHNPHWQNAMQDEFYVLIKNGTWVLVPQPPNVNVVRSMWLFKHKFHADGSLSRYKARLVANGKSQQQGIDRDETFSPVVKPATIRIVLSLAKSLYGLKQAPRAWFQCFASYALRVGFQHSKTDSSLFIYHRGVDTAYLLLYVDDIILTASSSGLLQQLLERAHMLNCNPCRTPVDTEKKLGPEGALVDDPTLYRSLAGGLQYLTFTRPDLSYVVQQLCLYMHDPREPHLNAMKRVLHYVRGTTDLGLQLYRSSSAYSDADWVGCPATRCVFLGTTFLRGLQNVKKRCPDLVLRPNTGEWPTPAVYMSANPVQHQCTKHIEIDIHFVREKVTTGHVRVLHVPSRFQYTDIFTQGLPYTLFADFRSSLTLKLRGSNNHRIYCIV